MAWGFKKRRQNAAHRRESDRARDERMDLSRSLLLDAVEKATDAAADVTHLLRSELYDSIRQFELTASILTDGLLVCAENGVVLSMNPAAERLFMRTTDHGAVRIKDLLDCAGTDQPLWDALASPESAIVAKRADGQTFAVDTSLAVLERSDGTITYLLLVSGDSQGDDLNGLLGRGFDGVFIVGRSKVLAANAAMGDLLGYTADDLTNLPLSAIVTSDEIGLFRSNSDNDSMDAQFDTTLLRADGDTFPARVALTHIDWAGTPVCVVTIEKEQPPRPASNPDDFIRCFGSDYTMHSMRLERDMMPLTCHLSPTLEVQYANAAFCDAYGLARGSYAGLSLSDVLSPSEFETASLHLMSLRAPVPERTLTVQSRRGGAVTGQEWIDSVMYDTDGVVLEYRRTGRITGHR